MGEVLGFDGSAEVGGSAGSGAGGGSVGGSVGGSRVVSVAIVDDHKFIVEGLGRSFELAGGVRVVGRAHSLAECRRMLEECERAGEGPEVMLLDVSLPDGNSLDALPELVGRWPRVRVLMLTSYAEAAVVARALAAGAAGYILKNSLSEEILEGVMAVAAGAERFLCEEAGGLVALGSGGVVSGAVGGEVVTLTRREREVLGLIVEGYTCREISERIFLSYDTVHDYYKYLRLKLGVNNTASLVREAILLGLV
ncbi:MAG: response regulator transcription factor [Alistipes sp.]|jgi:DNA-binding NarL/FixJ family response regulator|nr:response regulator transcription factor [Alistipes sp.]